MHLYLVQHGEAKSKEDDPQRHLTEKGLRDIFPGPNEVVHDLREAERTSALVVLISGQMQKRECWTFCARVEHLPHGA